MDREQLTQDNWTTLQLASYIGETQAKALKNDYDRMEKKPTPGWEYEVFFAIVQACVDGLAEVHELNGELMVKRL